MKHDAEALLDAGAVLTDAGQAAADTLDVLTIRAYGHPVLGDRAVVRLVPRTLGPAEDLTMEFLGFRAPQRVAEVGVIRQQALGFPAWALVNDPANGHHALALVKDIERLVRIAKSRIGPARNGFVELGDRLSRSVPHFLPTYYEEAARAFLAADSPTYAASMFGRARDAERAFGLKIDEDRQHTVFLEFALAGALSAKALSAHARDLAARSDAATAYERFRRLCIERTLGGMPPYASMHTDLRRLAKAAKLGAAEEESLLRELLAAPSVLRAPGSFWTAYRPALIRIAEQDPAVRGQLLGIFPHDCADQVWLEILEESGATKALTEPAGAVLAEADSPDGPAGWLRRLDQHRSGWRRKRLPVVMALVTRMAPRLIADAQPVELCTSRGYIDLDVVDLCMELGVPFAPAASRVNCNVEQWLNDTTDGRRPLAHIVTDERLLPHIAASLESRLRRGYGEDQASPERVAEIVAVPGLRTALHWWLDRLADQVVGQGLPGIDEQLTRLALVSCAEGLAVNPEAVRRIVGHDLGPVLGRTLRSGVFDEYGWPALEAAVESLFGPMPAGGDEQDNRYRALVQEQWPHLLLRTDDKVAVLGADGVELEHVLRIPADQRRYQWSYVLRHVDGQLLVSWDTGDHRNGYWSGTPDDVFRCPGDAFGHHSSFSLAMPGGGRTAGGRPLRVGDREAHERHYVAGDGRHFWTLVRPESGHEWRWHEYDVATGVLGRPSMPAFFEADAVDGQTLIPAHSWLAPAGAEREHSPLGHRDGLYGWRARNAQDGSTVGTAVGTGIDGRTFTLPGHVRTAVPRLHGALLGALRFPGADTLVGMIDHNKWRDASIILCAEDGTELASLRTGMRHDPFAEGTRMLPPARYWHYLRVRDATGSAALRAFTDEAAGRLLAAVVELVGTASQLDDAAARTLVGTALPEVTSPALLAGITGVVKQAARSTARLVAMTTATTEAAKALDTDPERDLPDDRTLNEALSGLFPSCYNRGHVAANLFTHVGTALLGREPARDIAPIAADADPDWFDVIAAVPAVLWRAVAPATCPAHRAQLLDLLDIIAASGLLTPLSRIRSLRLRADDPAAMPAVGQVLTHDGRRLVVLRSDRRDRTVSAVEYAADGRFGPVTGHAIIHDEVLNPDGWDSERLTEQVAAARAHGPLQWQARHVTALSDAAGVSLAEAVLLIADPLGGKGWQEHRPEGWQVTPAVTDAAIEAALEDRQQVAREQRIQLGGALLPDDLASLSKAGPSIDRVAAWHVERFGTRRPVADELIVELRKARMSPRIPASVLLAGLSNPDTCRWLAGTVPGIDITDVVVAVVRTVPWLVRRSPAGDPVRLGLPKVLEAVRRRLADPALEVYVGQIFDEKLPELVKAIGLPVTVTDNVHDAGFYKVVHHDNRWPRILFRPAQLDGADDPRLAALLAQLGGTPQYITAMRAVLAGKLDAWAEAAAATTGSEEDHDPSRSAPELVAEVAGKHGLGADAATLYLQLLALPDPTDRNVAAWTGWKPARLKAARAELAGTELVVEAKRPRAGRSLFLPGGWIALGVPNLPAELWKVPLFVHDGDNIIPLGNLIPVAPAPRLFALAWARVTGGDHPRFEELTTRGRR